MLLSSDELLLALRLDDETVTNQDALWETVSQKLQASATV
jgi:hypothetical protein